MSYWWFGKLVSKEEQIRNFNKFLKFFDEYLKPKLSISKQEELENLARYWKGRNGLGDNKRLEIAESNLLHYKKKEIEK